MYVKYFCHAAIVGVADQRDSIPEVHVFLTEITCQDSDQVPDKVFLTRSPCMEPAVVELCDESHFISEDYIFCVASHLGL